MTKEELYKKFYDWDTEQEICEYLDEFFSEHVCIKRGETLQFKSRIDDKWYDEFTLSKEHEYRTKPQESIEELEALKYNYEAQEIIIADLEKAYELLFKENSSLRNEAYELQKIIDNLEAEIEWSNS